MGLDHSVWVEVRSIAWHLSKDSLDMQPHFVEDRLSVPWCESEGTMATSLSRLAIQSWLLTHI